MTDYSSYSFWLETCGESLVPRPALGNSIDVDVAILGGGYTGFWTAYYLLRANPVLKVAVIEKEMSVSAPQAATVAGARRSFQ